ncbi:Hypothetical protein R9X50_00017800 [Acrodontium crateriforme]|uniref:Ureidoglycolate hydrolase n=1 Tax=Acrodontium crateriforme TaxID=150365 RepID=A0AAQ3R4Q5_9PEZI|nr:Hypothetical protein R9X50_00017800 [Acrodontium crateriforme]
MILPVSNPAAAVRVTPLDPDAFAPFGDVIQNPSTHASKPDLESVAANQGSATKWLDVTRLDNWYEGRCKSGQKAKSVMNMFVCKPRELQKKDGVHGVFPVRILERHPFTPQTFIPVGLGADDARTCYLVIVAPTLPLGSQKRDSTNMAESPLASAYPPSPPRRKRSLRERLLGSRPNPFTNDFTLRTTPSTAISQIHEPRGPGLPDLANLRAFIARGDQAVTYGPGTWHAPMVVLGERPVDFVVVQYANGIGVEDCQEVEINKGLNVLIESGATNLKAKL